MKNRKCFYIIGVIIGFSTHTSLYAGTNSLTAGLSVSYDYDKRENVAEGSADDVYQVISISPTIQYFYSSSALDRFGVRVSPSAKYDIEESETDFDYNDLLLTFDKQLSRHWRFYGSNLFLRSDEQDSRGGEITGPSGVSDADDSADTRDGETTGSSQTTAPTLSGDAGRNRYWSNDLELGTVYEYRPQSEIRAGFGYNILRNDSDSDAYTDYDRYVFDFGNSHRINADWKTILDLSFIIGDYDEPSGDSTLAPEDSDEVLSEDLKEYRLDSVLENNYLRNRTVSVSYSYIGAKYDEDERDDSDIHQGRILWLHQYTDRLSYSLGAGPSYEKTEGRDANYGGNGVLSASYRFKKSTVSFNVEKRYDVDNFSGTSDRGVVDIWDTGLSADYRLTRNLFLTGELSYLHEFRELPGADTDAAVEGSEVVLEEVKSDFYQGVVGLNYSFMRYYTAAVNYTYSKQESDVVEDEYNEHRIVLTLSWERELMRW